MEGSMIFCQKNVLEYSMSFHGDYKKRCILTTGGQSDNAIHQTNISKK
jgi:hypothetical protein